jgi:hypothetical protein
VEEWLKEIGLADRAAAFSAHGITLDDVGDLSEEDLRELGLTIGERKRLRRAVAALLERRGLSWQLGAFTRVLLDALNDQAGVRSRVCRRKVYPRNRGTPNCPIRQAPRGQPSTAMQRPGARPSEAEAPTNTKAVRQRWRARATRSERWLPRVRCRHTLLSSLGWRGVAYTGC